MLSIRIGIEVGSPGFFGPITGCVSRKSSGQVQSRVMFVKGVCVPHRDGTQTEHGFVSILPWAGKSAGLFWLDGRQFTSKEHGHGGHGSSADEMTLRFASVGPGGRLADEFLLDSRVCDCCQTSAAMTSEGAVALFDGYQPPGGAS